MKKRKPNDEICPACGSNNVNRNGSMRGVQNYKCMSCGRQFAHGSTKQEVIPVSVPSVKGITEADLRAKFDNAFIVAQKVKELTRDNFIVESEFISMCAFKGNNYRSAMERQEFADYHGTAGGKVYWGHREDIVRLKNEGILR